MSPIVRQARSLDLNDVAELWRTCHLVPSQKGFRNEMERKLINDPTLFLVAVEGEQILGAVMGGYDGRTSFVSRLGVHPNHRRRGVATALMDRLEACLEQLGAPTNRLLVLDNTGEAFWRGAGFEMEEQVPVYRRT